MKKLSIALAAFAAIALASCGGQTNKNTEAADSDTIVPVFAQAKIEAGIKANLDSIAADFAKIQSSSLMDNIKDGKIALSDEEKKVQPDYLLDPSAANDLQTFSQKYRAITMLFADKAVAELYGMDAEPYKAAIAKLATEIGDPILSKASEADSDPMGNAETFYKDEEAAGRINFFWEVACAGTIEQLYIICQNVDKFLPEINDDFASNVTFRIALIQDALERLSQYAPELEDLCAAIKPLEKLNAVSVDQLKEQLKEMKPEIEESRNALLK